MTIIITCAVIAIIIIAVLVSINIRSGSAVPKQSGAPEEAVANTGVPASVSVPETGMETKTGTETVQAPEPAPRVSSVHHEEAAPAVQDQAVGERIEQSYADIPTEETLSAKKQERKLNEPNSPSADEDFRAAIRRLQESPAPKPAASQDREKIADDAYRQALRSFMEKAKTEK
ncbi:hypothetical protein [Paenibacillus sp. J22TS3]|uniref:hypothetical protein n=1 Tax=Paenibacillus sp. J22TS3 TaxID=2807192 RepID=UPI001B138848|nr:hypothetical protein [Paenibacillus sp. J22TS3]GIP20387.1 hypothetical protein J22TS3_06620 [Paenibacillus sp. J22TS3]